MPKLGPISWRMFIVRMKMFGFEGPFQEGKHPYMLKGSVTVTIPNPHEGAISVDLLSRLLRQAGVSRDRWMNKR